MSLDSLRGLRIIVLGAAAGGGSPQWNCRCSVCEKVREGAPGTSPRTQTSIAVSADGQRWILINASPDLGEQLRRTRALHPAHGMRHSPVEAVVLTGGEIDQVAGLLTLRERQPFALYASGAVHATLEDSPIFSALNEALVPRRSLCVGESTEIFDARSGSLGIRVEAFAVPGKIPLYEEQPGVEPALSEVTEHTVALRIESHDGAHFYFVPCCAGVTDELADRLRGAPLVFFDGTLWRDDELIVAGLGEKTGRRMGHLSVSGPDGAMALLEPLHIRQKVFVHINNSNPILVATSQERRAVENAGWQVAFDGMEMTCTC
jgi:pyrroloquinoline quinone biosynthesis protein B